MNGGPVILSDPLITWPMYAPPYDSPIEDIFACHIVKYLPEAAQLHRQVEVDTQCGIYRVDFVCESNDRTVGLECDGMEFHDEKRDEWRDALIMQTGQLNAIYRFSGRNIYHKIDRALYLLSRCEKGLFSERGRINLKILGEADLISVNDKEYESHAFLEYDWFPEKLAYLSDDQDTYQRACLPVTMAIRKCCNMRTPRSEPEWVRKARFARRHAGKSLEEIMSLYPY
jgi:very-short-patch-repair endonuclease